MNHSGMQSAPDGGRAMMENLELTKPRGDEQDLARLRVALAKDADEPVGSLPEPKQSGVDAVLMDKLGERLAFERAGVRLYDALMVKCSGDSPKAIPLKDLRHIREEEAVHFALVGAAIQSLGGDPTAQTPGADVVGMENTGLMQVVTDPKTTVAQALHAMLVAEMVDNAAWDELIELTEQAGNHELVGRFTKARDEEQEHLEKVQGWYQAAVQKAAGA
jgi:rubrerythrin